MTNVFKKIFSLGISHCKNANELRLLKALNVFSFITIIGVVVGFLYSFYQVYDYPLVADISLLVVSLIIIGLNVMGHFRTALWLFIININLSVFYMCEFYGIASGSYLYYFPIILAIALLHIPGDSVWRTMNYFSITATLFTVSILIDFDFITASENSDLVNSFLLKLNIVVSVTISAIEIVMLVSLINAQNKEVMKLWNMEKNLHATAAKSLREKEVLLSEVHHRVKNNLAIINGLLNLQKNKTSNHEAATILEDSRNRIISMSLVHEKLYKSKDFSGIEIGAYLKELSEGIIKGTGNKYLKFESDTDTIKIPVATAIPVGLMVNESIVNSIKHAFEGTNRVNSSISLKVKKNNNELLIHCIDNGIGFSSGFDATKEETLGVLIMQSLAEQVEGQVMFYNNNGAWVEMRIPLGTP